MSVAAITRELLVLADHKKAAILLRFFKCGKGEYGEGDRFAGVTVPQIRSVAKRHADCAIADIAALLRDPIHECRLLALLLLASRSERAEKRERKVIVDFYLDHKEYVNNWDLVDSSAHQILGAYLLDRKRSVLDRFAKTNHLWTQRIAIVATYAFIRRGQLQDTFRIADILLSHQHDLIHKAVGWLLREAGKRDANALRRFLRPRYTRMPRTMLRYSIEKFPEALRQRYLAGTV